MVAQSVDLPPIVYGFGDLDCVLRLSTPAGAVLAYDVDGRLCPIGLNSAGLGITVFNLFQPHTCGFECPALSTQLVAWELLLGQYTLESAIAWLRSLPSPGVMCGSGLLLADESSAVMVELSAGAAPAISELTKGVPIVRANHGLLLQGSEENGESRKSVRESTRRQDSLTATLTASLQPQSRTEPPGTKLLQEGDASENGAGAVPTAGRHQALGVTAQAALKFLAASKGVRNVSTLACIACDVRRRRLCVEFRERQAAGEAETRELAKSRGLTEERAAQLLRSGAVRRQAKTGPRLEAGEPIRHFTRWEAYTYSLEGAQEGADHLPQDA